MPQTLTWTSHVDAMAPVEQERLALLEEIFDPSTARLLDEVDVRPGWDCLEVGAGAGSVARMLAERAGSDHVLATDMNIEPLAHLSELGIRVLQHDVSSDDAPGEFDLIHSRMVMEHITERNHTLARMTSWLKPGGVLLVEAASPLPEAASDPVVGRALGVLCALMSRSVGTDPGWARTLPRPLEEAGLVDCHAEGHVLATRGGGTVARWITATLGLVTESALASGALTEEELAKVHAAYADPAYVDYTWLTVRAYGRRARA